MAKKYSGTPENLLDTILGGGPGGSVSGVSAETRGLHLVALDRLLDNPYQARQEDEVEHILKIATSMAKLKRELPGTLGMQQPPTGRLVRLTSADDYEVLEPLAYRNERRLRDLVREPDIRVQLHFGHSRRQAFRVLAFGVGDVWPELEGRVQGPAVDPDYELMPLFLAYADKRAMFQHVATENAARKDLSAVEEALLLRQALDEFGMGVEEAGAIFGWARSTAANKLRLLQLPPEVQTMVRRGSVSERAARELCRLADEPEELAGALRLITQGDGVSMGRLASDVDFRVDKIRKAKVKAAELHAAALVLADGWQPWPGAGAVGVERMGLVDGVSEWQHKAFVVGAAECAVCTGECPCMRVVFKDYAVDGEPFRPAPEAAPSVLLACADEARRTGLLAAREAAIAADPVLAADAAAVREVAAAEAQRVASEKAAERGKLDRQAAALWGEFLTDLERGALWSSLTFWRAVAEDLDSFKIKAALAKAATPAEGLDNLLRALYARCERYSVDGRGKVIDLELLAKLVQRLEDRKR
ncbi:MAG: ParB/RepB/Spo0J family partition protein [Caldilineaceae bacterium]